jgi:hypothetical protein
VTNSELSSLGSTNLPQKQNIKGLRGLDAITGSANFDIAEYIWLKLIQELAGENATIALLCKTGVARNVIQFASAAALPVETASIHRIDSKKSFNVAADACLLTLELSNSAKRFTIPVHETIDALQASQTMTFANGGLVADSEAYKLSAFADGKCPLTWRQGIKHDAARVMELREDDGVLRNGLDEVVEVEDEFVFPLAKGTDVYHGRSADSRRAVIVPQRLLGEVNDGLEDSAPRLWRYLSRHRSTFDARMSSIYRSSSPFSIFGIGEYSFARYKVAISGLHKNPRFRALGPVKGKPVMLDDTSYFLPFQSAGEASLVYALLSSEAVTLLLQSLVFWDTKRPITKKVLMRIGLVEIAQRAKREDLLEVARQAIREISPEQSDTGDWPDHIDAILTDKFVRSKQPETTRVKVVLQPRLLEKQTEYQ